MRCNRSGVTDLRLSFNVLTWAPDLRLSGNNLYLDSRIPRASCFVSHAHSDHLGLHEQTVCTPATAAFAEHRVGPCGATVSLDYDIDYRFDPDTSLRLLPAGHVLGSAMLHITRPEGSLLYTGDFKLRQSLTCAQAEPIEADYLVMESTYGLPHFIFPDQAAVTAELLDLVERAFKDNRQPIIPCSSLGKAQETTRILPAARHTVTQHGAAFNITQLYRELGVETGPARKYLFSDFHGETALDLRQRGVLIAPPHCARTPFVTRFTNPCRIIITGWALLKNAIYRYGVDHALPLSDHADFNELLELIDRVRPKKIFTHHGYPEFVDHLRMRGLDAQLARPADQLSLFD